MLQVRSALYRRDFLIVATVSLTILVARLMVLYQGDSPEPDALAMVAGMTMAIRGDVPLREAFLYGREGSPGMFLFGRFVYPIFSRDPANLLTFLNWFTMLASLAMAWPAYAIARTFLKPGAATAAVLIALLTPVVWELSTYFHPEIPAAALLLFAVHAAIRADRSRARSVCLATAALLGVGAFLCRFHVVFALPGLITAALLSRHRLRYLVVLVGTTVLAAGAYAALQVAAVRPDSAPSDGFLGYLKMVANMYAHNFSLPGLSRSIVWAACGMGIMSLAALTVCWRPWWKATPEAQVLKRGVMIGLAWALPSLLFWLPQPVPVLRHHVLPALGMVLAIASGFLAFRLRRGLIAAAALIIAGNIAIPEIAYRAYNALHPDGPKTPHGAVFYSHDVMLDRIARFDQLASSVSRVTQTQDGPGVIVFTQWEGYAHLLYHLAQTTPGLYPTSTSMFFDSVQDRRYQANAREFRFINYVYFEDPELKRRGVQLIRETMVEGYAVFVPRELANGPLAGLLPASGIAIY